MAMVHVNRSGTSLGIFSEDDIREGLRAGRFAATDLGWREGMAQWQPLSQFPEFAAVGTEPAAAVPPAPGPPLITTTAGVASSLPAPGSGLPWDQREQRGLFTAFFETMMMILTKPAAAFTAMHRAGGLGGPLLYALIGGTFGILVNLLFTLAMPSFGSFGDRENPLLHVFGAGAGMVVSLIFVPFFLVIGIFVGAAIVHVCLMIVGGAKQSFETTFRVVCFVIGSVDPLLVIPVCGGVIVLVWGVVLNCIGLARTHETETWRAVLAIFLPLIICCGGGIFLAMMFGLLGALSNHANF